MITALDRVVARWERLAEFLMRSVDESKKDEMLFSSEVEKISPFISHTILSLLNQEKQRDIEKHIDTMLAIFEQKKEKGLLYLNSDEISQANDNLNKICYLFAQEQNDLIKFLAEKNEKVEKFLKKKEEIIENRARQIFEEKLPRFLASAFEREVKALSEQIKNKERIFYISIIILVLCAFCIKETNYIHYLSIYFPVIWGLWYLTKNINENRRLLHEYKHKAVLARTYTLYSEQLEKHSDRLFFDDSDRRAYQELAYSFLEENIKSLTHNPAQSLDKGSKEMPYSVLLEKLIGNIRKYKDNQ